MFIHIFVFVAWVFCFPWFVSSLVFRFKWSMILVNDESSDE